MSITKINIAIEPSSTVFKVNTTFLNGFKHLTFNICCRNDLFDYLVMTPILLREINGYTINRLTSGYSISTDLFNKLQHVCDQYNRGVNINEITDLYGVVLNRRKEDIDEILRQSILTQLNAQNAARRTAEHNPINSPVSGAVNNIFQSVVSGNINRDVWQSLIRNLGESLFTLAGQRATQDGQRATQDGLSPEAPFDTFIRNVRERLNIVNAEPSSNNIVDDDREVYIYNQNDNQNNILHPPTPDIPTVETHIPRAQTPDNHAAHMQPLDLNNDTPKETRAQRISKYANIINNKILQNKTLHPNFRKHTLGNYKKIKNYLLSVLRIDMNNRDIKQFMKEIIRLNPNINAP